MHKVFLGFLPGCTFLAAQLLLMHKTEPFKSQHVKQYLGHTHHGRFEILLSSVAVPHRFLDPIFLVK
jgi:hypothetical protein